MTPDLQRLRDTAGALDSLLQTIAFQFVDDAHWDEPSDTSYLTAAERADPDIASNVEAMAATNALIAWFGRDHEGYVGLWQGPSRRPLRSCPVVRLDTEGQYALLAATVADYVAVSTDEDDFDGAREALLNAGFHVRESADAIWQALEPFDNPNDFRHTLYNQAREGRGLKAVE